MVTDKGLYSKTQGHQSIPTRKVHVTHWKGFTGILKSLVIDLRSFYTIKNCNSPSRALLFVFEYECNSEMDLDNSNTGTPWSQRHRTGCTPTGLKTVAPLCVVVKGLSLSAMMMMSGVGWSHMQWSSVQNIGIVCRGSGAKWHWFTMVLATCPQQEVELMLLFPCCCCSMIQLTKGDDIRDEQEQTIEQVNMSR